jgi:hypothetical protein
VYLLVVGHFRTYMSMNELVLWPTDTAGPAICFLGRSAAASTVNGCTYMLAADAAGIVSSSVYVPAVKACCTVSSVLRASS